jgi:tellurite resistance protein TehA-like permease
LAVHTGLPVFKAVAVIAYGLLIGTWLLVAVRTARGGIRGQLFTPPPTAPVRARKG